jgi:hypothetical protein
MVAVDVGDATIGWTTGNGVLMAAGVSMLAVAAWNTAVYLTRRR